MKLGDTFDRGVNRYRIVGILDDIVAIVSHYPPGRKVTWYTREQVEEWLEENK